MVMGLLAVSGCSLPIAPPAAPLLVFKDQQVQEFLEWEGRKILAVSEDHEIADSYKFYVADLAAKGIAGQSLGNHIIALDREMVFRAHQSSQRINARDPLRDKSPRPAVLWEDLWVFRMVLAHEIGHEVLGHVRTSFVLGLIPYVSLAHALVGWAFTPQQELAADRKGLEYWQRLGWPCDWWVRRLQTAKEQGFEGDYAHRTEGRLEQAQELCGAPTITQEPPKQAAPGDKAKIPACPEGMYRKAGVGDCVRVGE